MAACLSRMHYAVIRKILISILFIFHIQKTWQVMYKIWVRISIERERVLRSGTHIYSIKRTNYSEQGWLHGCHKVRRAGHNGANRYSRLGTNYKIFNLRISYTYFPLKMAKVRGDSPPLHDLAGYGRKSRGPVDKLDMHMSVS